MTSPKTEVADEPHATTLPRLRLLLLRLPVSLSWGVFGFVAVMAVALVIRVVNLGTVPANATADETGFLREVYHILAGTGAGLFDFDWTPSPALSVYTMAAVMKVFGVGLVGARMYPVLLSMGTLVAFFFLARERLSYLASLLATLLLAGNLWFLHFSRTAWTNMNADLFAVTGALMLALAVRKGNYYYYAAAGAFAALGLYGYFSGRLLIVFFLAYLPLALLLNRDRVHLRRISLGYALLLVTCVTVFAPQIKPTIDHWDDFNRRPEAVSILKANTPYLDETDRKLIVARQAVWAARAFVLVEDGGVMNHGLWPRYIPIGRGLLDPWTRWFFFAGLAAALWRWRQTALWWVMFLVPVFTIQVMSTGTPDAARGLIVAPFMFLFVGQGIDLLLAAARRIDLKVPGIAVGATVALAGFSGLIVVGNVREYFDWIDTPAALDARLPGVYHEDFDLFQQLEREAAEKGPGSFWWPDWCAQHRPAMTGDVLCTPGTIEGLCCSTVLGFREQLLTDGALARDEQRRSDFDAIENALLAYRARYGSFPDTGSEVQPLCEYPQLHAGCAIEEFLEPLPQEPRPEPRFGYWYRSDGLSYSLYAALESKPPDLPLCATVPAQLQAAEFPYCVSGP